MSSVLRTTGHSQTSGVQFHLKGAFIPSNNWTRLWLLQQVGKGERQIGVRLWERKWSEIWLMDAWPFMRWLYGALMAFHDQCTTKLLGYKHVPVPLDPPQTPHGLTWHWTLASTVKNQPTDHVSHDTGVNFTYMWSTYLTNCDSQREQQRYTMSWIAFFHWSNVKSNISCII